jgi:hypothetical protein
MSMNGVRTIAVSGLLLAAAVAGATPPDRSAEGRAIAMAFGGELKAALQGAMAEGGPLATIEVCHARAPAIAAEASATSGARVGRTALKVRNPANAPDAHERATLQVFAERLAREPGAVPEALEVLPDGRVRYMRAILTDGVCVACHGASLAPEVAEAIDALYPGDEARGFAPGDLRGAFTITWPAE